jgi:hypothetical protein
VTDIQSLIARSSLGTGILVCPVIVAGSRGIDVSLDRIHEAMDAWLDDSRPVVPNEIVSGCARGIDRCGEAWAASVGLPVKRFPVRPSEWKRYGKFAGPRRNDAMSVYGGALLAFWDGVSRGTADMIDRMRARRKPVRVVAVRR